MGIFNATPDSFFEPSRYNVSVFSSGADIIDIGAVSTRPGYSPVSVEEEWSRLEPVLRTVPEDICLSIDTTSSIIVGRTLDLLGRKFIVNDISAGADDPGMLPMVAREGLRYVAMHRGGFGKRAEVAEFFMRWGAEAGEAGIEDWILDPGFGFGKDIADNWDLLEHLSELMVCGRPVLVGVSRKRMTYGSAEITEKAHRIALEQGAGILRVHDVPAARRTLEEFYSPSNM